MTIRIVTDSTCDLPAQVLERHQITVLPLYIHIGTQSYRDRIDLTREQFYNQLPVYPIPPQTAAPAPELFEQAYRALIAEGATEILSIHISASLSAISSVIASMERMRSPSGFCASMDRRSDS